MIKLFIFSLIFFSSFTSSFAISQYLPLWVITLFLLIFFCLLRLFYFSHCKSIINPLRSEDLFIALFFVSLVVSSVFYNTDKTFNYILAYFVVFILLYLFNLFIFANFSDIQFLLTSNQISICFVAAFCIITFLLNSMLGIDINSYIPNIRERTATIYGTLGPFNRTYGFSSEPTTLAMYFLTLGPLGIYQSYRNIKRIFFRFLYVLTIFLAFLLTFSSAGFAILAMSLFIVYIFAVPKHFKIPRYITALRSLQYFFLSLMAILLYNVFLNFSSVVDKIIFSSDSSSATSRATAVIDSLKVIQHNFVFGTGLGSSSVDGVGSSLNWFVFLFKEAGIMPFVLISTFLILTFIRFFHSPLDSRPYLLFSLLSGIIFLNTNSSFFQPCFWIFIIIARQFTFNANHPKSLMP